MLILDGKAVAKQRLQDLYSKIHQFCLRVGRPPHLAVVLVGQDPASAVYVRNKIKTCLANGIQSKLIQKSNLSQTELDEIVLGLNQDPEIDGILVQLPLPPGLSADRVNLLMAPEKDVDGFSFTRLGYFYGGDKRISPCTPKGIISILKHYKIDLRGRDAIVVGRSLTVGRPMAELLISEDATVTVCHSHTPDLRAYTRRADLVVVAAGKRELLGKEDFKQGAVVIDVGIHGSGLNADASSSKVEVTSAKSKIVGDVRFHELQGWVSAATPVPGGVGPMTIVSLLENLILLAYQRAHLEFT
jgi:methylenetetrahydrofolate dehydrogenase (NADP+)/methenyltetrahydrofolate cyclohydrolase